MKGIRVVSWDVDGTLFSYFRLIRELLRTTTFVELWKMIRFHRAIEKQRHCAESRVRQFEGFSLSRFRERQVLRNVLRRIQPRPQAVQLIRQFATAGIVQVVFSDFESDYKLEALGLREYFAGTYSSEEIGFWKPSPVALMKIQQDFGILPQQHLHIGDRKDADGEACLRNGCHFLLI